MSLCNFLTTKLGGDPWSPRVTASKGGVTKENEAAEGRREQGRLEKKMVTTVMRFGGSSSLCASSGSKVLLVRTKQGLREERKPTGLKA
ncbi:hypothetical protein E2542_SST08481 [Spatholobus suberectus]|nr:hypothetical protein E2542_SST08481 [Spatholobus suberectus]